MKTMTQQGTMARRTLLGCALVAVLTSACKAQRANGSSVQPDDRIDDPKAQRTKSGAVRPEEPVDEAFRGCQKSSCGTRTAPDGVELAVQPNAKLGDYTRCPVSGAAFRITETTQRREYRGRSVFLCCAGCASYFDEHANAVAALRNL